MKNSLRFVVFSLAIVLAVAAFGAGMPTLDVMVMGPDGKVVYKGRTNADGTFSTGTMAPGNYVVQFNSKSALKGNQYALVVGAGKQKVSAEDVAGSKFAGGGVAMRLQVGKGLKITGQVASGLASANPNVKIIKGKRYVWVKGGETGSHLGGRWEEEGSPAARGVGSMSQDEVTKRQDHGDTSAAGR